MLHLGRLARPGTLTVSSLTLVELPGTASGPVPGPGEIHLSYCDAIVDLDDLAKALALLAPEERKRADAIRDKKRRERFVRGRAQCRRMLSTYVPVAPTEWRFALGARGKPYVAAPVLAVPLWFSLSHGENATVCAVTTSGPDIGVDLEPLDPTRDGTLVAQHFFPSEEAQALGRLAKAQRGIAFTQHWVLKESLAKAAECSLTDALSGSQFAITESGHLTATLDGATFGKNADWHFGLFCRGASEVGAVSLKTSALR